MSIRNKEYLELLKHAFDENKFVDFTVDLLNLDSSNLNRDISKISKLDLEEEREVLDEINYKVKTKLLYSKIDKNNNYKLTTRKEENIKNKLLDFLNSSKENTELIDYLYYEWFNKTSSSNKYNELLSSVKNEYSDKHNKLFKIIELINS